MPIPSYTVFGTTSNLDSLLTPPPTFQPHKNFTIRDMQLTHAHARPPPRTVVQTCRVKKKGSKELKIKTLLALPAIPALPLFVLPPTHGTYVVRDTWYCKCKVHTREKENGRGKKQVHTNGKCSSSFTFLAKIIRKGRREKQIVLRKAKNLSRTSHVSNYPATLALFLLPCPSRTPQSLRQDGKREKRRETGLSKMRIIFFCL